MHELCAGQRIGCLRILHLFGILPVWYGDMPVYSYETLPGKNCSERDNHGIIRKGPARWR